MIEFRARVAAPEDTVSRRDRADPASSWGSEAARRGQLSPAKGTGLHPLPAGETAL